MTSTTETARGVTTAARPGVRAFALLLLLGLGFAVVFAFNRVALTNGIPLTPYVLLQSAGATLILLPVCVARGELPSLSWDHLRVYGVTGLLSVVVPLLVLSAAAPHVPSGILSLTITLTPLLTYGFSLVARLDRFAWLRLGGIALGFVGVLFVLVPQTSLPGPDMAGWMAFALIAPVCYAVCTVAIALMRPPAARSLPLTFGLVGAGALMMIPVVAIDRAWWFFDGPFGDGHLAVLGAMLNTAVIYVLMFEIIRIAGPVFFSTVNYIATLIGVFIGILAFGDAFSVWVWAALLAMFAGLFLVSSGGVVRRFLA